MHLSDLTLSLRAVAEATPGRLAVADGTGSMSYGAMLAAVDRTASGLHERGVRTGDRVGLLLGNCIDGVVGMYACLQVGAVFVPLPIGDPVARTSQILDDCRPALLLANRPFSGPCPTVAPSELQGGAKANAPVDLGHLHPRRLAYCIYTSGTTGSPKGVLIRQDSLANVVGASAEVFGFDGSTRSLCTPPFHFDGAFGSIFPVHAAGGTVIISTPELLLLPRAYIQAVLDLGITHGSFSPSILRVLLAHKDVERLGRSALRTVSVFGEDCSFDDIRRLQDIAPDVRVHNRYGPTETTCVVSSADATEARRRGYDKVPIGRPYRNVRFYLRDEADNLIEGTGQAGELCIGGVQVMEGYWEDKAATDAALRSDVVPGETVYLTRDLVRRNEDGEYFYVDRIDNVVKRNGVRIGLAEVTQRLREIDGVANAATISVGTHPPAIHSYVVATTCLSGTDLRKALLGLLPVSMHPDKITMVAELPLTPAGKVDGKALLAGQHPRPSTAR